MVQTQGLVFEQIAAPQWAWQASLIHASADNRAYPGAALPYLPRYTLGLGLTWFAPERWVIQANASRRTGRYSDDQSLTKESSAYLAADWDVALRATWQDPAKRYLFELYARGLARKDDSASVGLRAVWRY